MLLEDVLTFETLETQFGPLEQIRIKGHRISIDHVLSLHRTGFSPKCIAEEFFPSLKLEEVVETIGCSRRESERIEKYLQQEIIELLYDHYLFESLKDGEIVSRLKAVAAKRQFGSDGTLMSPIPTMAHPTSEVRFLLDEHVTRHLESSMCRIEPSMDIVRVGAHDGAPSRGASDLEVIKWADANGRLIITYDLLSMAHWAKDHQDRGGKTSGIFNMHSAGYSAERIAQDLHLVWLATKAREWQNLVRCLPLMNE